MESSIDIREGLNRVAWTQYEHHPHNGMGSGLNAYKHKQPTDRHGIKTNFYVKE
jgi:hypothetical protein